MGADSSGVTRVTKIIQLAFILSAVIYPVVTVVVIQSGEPADRPPIGDVGPYFLVAAVVALASLVVSFWIPAIIASDEKIEQALRAATSPGESPSPSSAQSVLFPAFVIKLALLEAIAIFGLVLSLIVWDAAYAIGFSVVSLVFLVMARDDSERAARICRRIDVE